MPSPTTTSSGVNHFQGSQDPHDSQDPQDHSPSLQRQNTGPSNSSTSSSVAAGSGFFTFPVTYSVNGLLRRLSGDTAMSPTDTPPTSMPRKKSSFAAATAASSFSSSSLPKSLSSSFSSWTGGAPRSSSLSSKSTSHAQHHQQPLASGRSSLSSSSVVYVPAPVQRVASPFQPPPLTPLVLADDSGGRSNSMADDLAALKLLSTALAEEIRLLVPAALQLVSEWRLVFGLERDGVSLATLYDKCEAYRGKRGGFVLVVRDESGGIFGAFLTDAPHPSSHFYGTGECFLWRASILASIPDLSSLPPPPSADTTNATRMTTLMADTNGDGTTTADRIRFKAFPYSGVNDYMIFCQSDFLSVGGGDGHYGLWLDDSLDRGISSSCPTFGNEPLSDDGTKFSVMGVEIWYMGA